VGVSAAKARLQGLRRQAVTLGDAVEARPKPRLRLLSMIGAHDGGEACVCELTDAFDLTPPTISHHLKVLRDAGLIACERRGTWVYYWVLPETMDRLTRLFTPERVSAGAV
jgi:ArsR family transcriptional regulator, arsenate/arsenite/antimonite-responsive transcriptional repressor